jgi:hypothetical protein
MAIPVRGLRGLRTLSGRADQTAEPYRAYMQITCLEMERARRGAERRSANQRIAEIDARMAEIEREKRELLRRIEQRGEPRLAAGRFKVRYGGAR